VAREFLRSGLAPRTGFQHVVRPLLLLAVLLVLAALAGGFALLGVWPAPAAVAPAALAHGALMIGGLFGAVIGIERAVALRERWAFVAPAAFVAGGVVVVLGMPRLGALYMTTGALVFIAVNVALLRRQFAAHTVLLVAAAAALLAGFAARWLGGAHQATLALWFSFLLLTIAAERLEMARLMVRRPESDEALFAICTLMLLGALGAWRWPAAGAALFGAAVAALALWLLCFDIARKTVRGAGLSRYMAACLLTGYGWLLLGGLAWVAQGLGWGAWRDTALHAIALGFVVAMVMAHAPVILPAIAGLKLAYHPGMYAPLGMLQASLLLRAAGDVLQVPALKTVGAGFNLLTVLAFAASLAVGAGLWKRASHRVAAAVPRTA